MYLMPLLATFLSSVYGGTMVARGLGHRGIAVFSILSLAVAFISSAIIWVEVVLGSCEVSIDLFGTWFEVGTFNVSWNLYFDLLTAHMLFTVTSVSLAVHLYAVVYMRSDPHLTLFMSYLSLFTFFMLVLVTGDSLVMMLVGWEGNIICPSGFICFNLLCFGQNGHIMCSLVFLKPLKLGETRFCKGSFLFSSVVCKESDFVMLGINPLVLYKHLVNSKLSAEEFVKQYKDLQQKQNLFYTKLCDNGVVECGDGKLMYHSSLFIQILTGGLLGDAWLEKNGSKARFGISQSDYYKDVMQFYFDLLYGLGYIKKYSPLKCLSRNKQLKSGLTPVSYYQLRTTRSIDLGWFYDQWYLPYENKHIKIVPFHFIQSALTPLCLALWIMGDGSGMKDGGFKLSTHSFDIVSNCFLAHLLNKKYGLTCSVHTEGKSYYIRIWKKSVPTLKNLVMPFMCDSTLYKFRHVK